MIYILLPIVAGIAALATQYFGVPYAPYILGFFASLLSVLGLKAVSRTQNNIAAIVSTLLVATVYILEKQYLVAALSAVGLWTFVIRFALFETMLHEKYLWVEIVGALIGGGLLIGVFVTVPGYSYWIVSALYFLLGVGGMMRQLVEKKQMGVIQNYGVRIGDKAPEFQLNDHNGELTKLSQFQGLRHVLLIFVRGDWCPFCHVTLRVYERERERFKEKDVLVMAIGPDPVGVNRGMVEKLGLDYKVLSDDKFEIVGRYGIHLKDKKMGFKEGEPLPAAFLIDKNGILRYTSNPQNVGEFLTPETIFPVLAKL